MTAKPIDLAEAHACAHTLRAWVTYVSGLPLDDRSPAAGPPEQQRAIRDNLAREVLKSADMLSDLAQRVMAFATAPSIRPTPIGMAVYPGERAPEDGDDDLPRLQRAVNLAAELHADRVRAGLEAPSPSAVRLTFYHRVFAALESVDSYDLYWRTDAEWAPCTLFVRCNDVFYWASSDSETITADNVGELELACKDVLTAIGPDGVGRTYAGDLFCARIKKKRPQGAFYRGMPKELVPLFDACGPERSPNEPGNTRRPA